MKLTINILFRLVREAKRLREVRAGKRMALESTCREIPEAAASLKSFNRMEKGRPRKEVDQPELLSTILKIVEASSAAHDRRRTGCLRSVTTLNDLHSELTKLGFNLSRSATHL